MPPRKTEDIELPVENNTTTKNLWQKLVDIRREINIGKTGHSDQLKYDFTEYDEVADQIGTLLAENNIVFSPSLTLLERKIETTANGKQRINTTVGLSGNFINADIPEEQESFMWAGEADSYNDDKSTQKAGTSAVKYFLLKFFLVKTGEKDDTENDSFVSEAEDKLVARMQEQTEFEKPSDNDRLQLFNVITAKLGVDKTRETLLKLAEANNTKSTAYIPLETYQALVNKLNK